MVREQRGQRAATKSARGRAERGSLRIPPVDPGELAFHLQAVPLDARPPERSWPSLGGRVQLVMLDGAVGTFYGMNRMDSTMPASWATVSAGVSGK